MDRGAGEKIKLERANSEPPKVEGLTRKTGYSKRERERERKR